MNERIAALQEEYARLIQQWRASEVCHRMIWLEAQIALLQALQAAEQPPVTPSTDAPAE